MRGISGVTDYYLLATGNSPPHLKALAVEIARELDSVGVHCYRRAGTPDSQWIVADYLDIVIHIFSPATRLYYDLERLWSDAKRVGLC